ncbi:MAG: Guanylate kinase, partial [uncultured Thermomicrobiales bacterium]
ADGSARAGRRSVAFQRPGRSGAPRRQRGRPGRARGRTDRRPAGSAPAANVRHFGAVRRWQRYRDRGPAPALRRSPLRGDGDDATAPAGRDRRAPLLLHGCPGVRRAAGGRRVPGIGGRLRLPVRGAAGADPNGAEAGPGCLRQGGCAGRRGHSPPRPAGDEHFPGARVDDGPPPAAPFPQVGRSRGADAPLRHRQPGTRQCTGLRLRDLQRVGARRDGGRADLGHRRGRARSLPPAGDSHL